MRGATVGPLRTFCHNAWGALTLRRRVPGGPLLVDNLEQMSTDTMPAEAVVETKTWSVRELWTSIWMTLSMTLWRREQSSEDEWRPEEGVGDWKSRLAALYNKSVDEMEDEDQDETETETETDQDQDHMPVGAQPPLVTPPDARALEDAELYAAHPWLKD